MSHIVIEKCIRCKYTDCVSVCPVDCFYENNNFLVIDPETCIDCAICVSECPLEAIIYFDINNKKLLLMYNINKKFSKIWKNIVKNKNAYNNNLKWKNIKNKLHLLKI
ncbi:4Fe-4S ferredoxin, iron-sulfur binding [Candidatus Nasuia deltocephalinicola]|nr:4Fe-4S ferredoxin, iron-sulfur binding [Candidatus Nasuia deltocephalinicola]